MDAQDHSVYGSCSLPLVADPSSPPCGPYDPRNCKLCPEWDEAIGRCRLPIRQRACGSLAYKYDRPPAGKMGFNLW